MAAIPLGASGANGTPVLGGFFDSGSSALSIQETHNGVGQAGTLVMGDGFVSVGGADTVLSNGVLSSYAGAIIGWRDYLGVAGTWFDLNTATGQLALVAASIAQSADRDVVDLGVCDAPMATRLARARGLSARTRMRQIEIHHSRGLAASLRGMFGHLYIAVQGRLGYSRSKDIRYRAFVAEGVAKDILFEKRGVRRFFRDKARALSWTSDRLPIPEISRPEAIPLGDEITLIRSGAWILSVLAGNLAIWAGVQATLKGDVAIRVRKLGEFTVEVMYTPTSVKSLALVATSALGLQATVDRAPAKALRQVFTFDLRCKAARDAYHDALKGKLPGALHKTRPGNDAAGMAKALQAALREEVDMLPEGVGRVYAHALHAVQKRKGGGIHLYLIPRFVLPKGWEPGWMRHRIKLRETEAIAQTEGAVFTDSWITEARAELGWRGLRSKRAVALSRQETKDGRDSVQSLVLHATISQGRMSVRRLNRKVIADLRKKFNICLPAHEPMEGKRAWLVEMYRMVDARDMARLVSLGSETYSTPMASTAHALRMSNLAERTGIVATQIVGFLKTLATERQLAGQVRQAQAFVQAHGISGIAALHGLLGDDPTQLQTKITQSNYEKTLVKARRLVLKYSDSTVRTQKSKAGQVEELRRCLKCVQSTRMEMDANPGLTARDRYDMLGELYSNQQQFQAAISKVDGEAPHAHVHRHRDVRGHHRTFLERVALPRMSRQRW